MSSGRNPHRFGLSRAGIHQVWQYDEEFSFGGGRLLLRGKNGAGKSKALEVLLPFLLDGDTRKLDAAGGGKTTLKWLMLDGWTAGVNRLGYLWVEFTAAGFDGGVRRLTIGAAIKASASTGEAKPLFFVTRLAVGERLPLHDPARRPTPDQLRELVGPENCYDRAVDYRGRVARELFGLTDPARYRNLVHLLHGLRRPTIGDRIESGELVKVLSDALPPLDEEVIDKVARNLDDLDSVRDELARLEQTDAALTAFLRGYLGYLRGVLRGRIGQVRAGLDELSRCRREAGDTERKLAALRGAEASAGQAVASLEEARDAAETDLRALRASKAYGALRELHDRRAAVRATDQAARAAWQTADLARDGEATAAGRLADEAEQIGRELADLRGLLRDSRRVSRGCGVDEALLGEPPSARATALSVPLTERIDDVDGAQAEIDRPGADVIDPSVRGDLSAWRVRLTQAEQVMKARVRAVEVLQGRLKEAAAAERKSHDLRSDAERLDGQLTAARQREGESGHELAGASAGYAGRVRFWAQRLPGQTPLITLLDLPQDDELPVTERALGRDTPEAVGRIAHEIADPVLASLEAERDGMLATERGVDAELGTLRTELRRWEQQEDPEPPRSSYALSLRVPGTGAPLFALVDFADSLDDSDRPGLEAALEASGLLSAWACADGTLLAEDTRDVLLRSGRPAPGANLSDVLSPVAGHGVSEAAVDRILRTIGLGDSAAHSWVAPDGRWRLGVARGAFGKERAEYIGAAVRAATRQHRMAELAGRIGELAGELERATAARVELEQRRDRLRRALREAPACRPLTDAWTAYDRAIAETARLAEQVSAARRAAQQAVAAAAGLRTRAQAQATSDGLPADSELLVSVRADLGGLRQAVASIDRDAGRTLTRLDAHAQSRLRWEAARHSRTGYERDYAAALATLVAGRRELALLDESVGAAEQEIIASERDALQRQEQAQARLREVAAALTQAHDDRIWAEAERKAIGQRLADTERRVVDGGASLRRPLGMADLPLAAGLGDTDAALERYDDAQDGDVRIRIAALRALAGDIESRLGPASADVSDSQIYRRGQELRDGLAGGYDAESEEVDGIKRFELRDDSGAHDVAVVGARIRAAAEAARGQLSAREQEVFEHYLLGELGDHLSRQVLAARELVTAMNATLDEVRSSHGIGARLQWELPKESDADVTAAVALLKQPSALRTREQSAQLRDALRLRIEEARLADPSAGYAQHLRIALDYRGWFAFKVKVTDAANPDRERLLSHRTALSQGEQRVVSYLVLFATAAAHFSSIAATGPTAPRLILLDDAFAKVDEPTHGRLLGLLVDLDLDFIITSERLWGCFATVPQLHIYECLRDPHVRGVAAVHFTWDGHSRRLVGG